MKSKAMQFTKKFNAYFIIHNLNYLRFLNYVYNYFKLSVTKRNA